MDENGKALPWNTEDENAVNCDVCPLAYQYQYLYWKMEKFCTCPKKCTCTYKKGEWFDYKLVKTDKSCPVHNDLDPDPKCPVHKKVHKKNEKN